MDINIELDEAREDSRDVHRMGAVDHLKYTAEQHFADLHPVHKARAYRELQAHAVEKACEQERINTDQGVPE